MRGAWIEMPSCPPVRGAEPCRSPCGERGLKYLNIRIDDKLRLSLPMRGAWIEIILAAQTESTDLVAPHAGSVD